MNFLAHILLSGPDPDVRVGGLLGDFIKGPLNGRYPLSVEQGIQLHRQLDAYLDGLAEFQRLLKFFPKPWRRYGGIVTDIVFDHLLARDWQQFHEQELDPFCQEFYRQLEVCRPWLPENARQFCDRAPVIGWLQSYRDPELMPMVLNRVGERFKKPVALAEAWPIVQGQLSDFEEGLESIMAQLKQYADAVLDVRPRL